MRVTIIKDDNRVIVDGISLTVDCKDLPDTFHALQWDGTTGEIEHRMTVCDHCGARSKKPNELTTDMRPYQKYVDAWGYAKATLDFETAEAERKAKELAAGGFPQAVGGSEDAAGQSG